MTGSLPAPGDVISDRELAKSDLIQIIAEALQKSFDLDWTPTVGAHAVYEAIEPYLVRDDFLSMTEQQLIDGLKPERGKP